eukprot:TRINITY_DN3887_c1_g1_i1.p1 TRINITY_DN3887_c1_g1~~TRINITY_DN3887_c1_g1_i1.p1  ORF type:complete len:199 (-),score=44.64 TRINITY_DN3887_c1_g1_i1:33-593(-)
MKAEYILGSIFVILAVSIYYLGLLDTPTEPFVNTADSLNFAYVKRKGDFSHLSEGFNSAKKIITSVKDIRCKRGVGVFFDDPSTVDAVDLRWWVGFVIPDDIELKNALSTYDNITVLSIPPEKAVRSYFPWKSFLSPMMGPSYVYPILEKYISENGYEFNTSVEIYDEDIGLIEYRIYQNDFTLEW